MNIQMQMHKHMYAWVWEQLITCLCNCPPEIDIWEELKPKTGFKNFINIGIVCSLVRILDVVLNLTIGLWESDTHNFTNVSKKEPDLKYVISRAGAKFCTEYTKFSSKQKNIKKKGKKMKKKKKKEWKFYSTWIA